MRLYWTNIGSPWSEKAIDREERLSLGIVSNFHIASSAFEYHVFAKENDNPVHPNGQRAVPKVVLTLGLTYVIEFRNVQYSFGTCPKQTRKVVPLTIGPSQFTTIPDLNLENLLYTIAPWTDTTSFTTFDYYNHIIRDGGTGTPVRELLIDGRDVGF